VDGLIDIPLMAMVVADAVGNTGSNVGVRNHMSDERLHELVRSVLAGPRPLAVTRVGDPVLRAPAARYEGQLPDELLRELLDAMRAHLPGVGVGLAAPQLGIPLALAVIEDAADVSAEVAAARERVPQPVLELVNPVVTAIGPQRRSFYEGCLSVAGLTAVVARHRHIRVSALDRHGASFERELRGWPARIVQHEIDHLNGILYLDRAELRSLSTMDVYQRLWADPTPDAAADALSFARGTDFGVDGEDGDRSVSARPRTGERYE
jgi:peptide deformylase